jgi:hypothetical protein
MQRNPSMLIWPLSLYVMWKTFRETRTLLAGRLTAMVLFMKLQP